MPTSAAVYGCHGTELSAKERDFFRVANPFGFILFARNISAPEQVRELCRTLREASRNRATPIFIDQEGGRVARLKPPYWRERAPARRFGELYETSPESGREAAYLSARLTAHELKDLGINVNCTPVLDVPVPGAHDIISDRAFAMEPLIVIELGRAVMDGCIDGGVLPVIKHIPGHGRAEADFSHHVLPRVAANVDSSRYLDFVPFRGLSDAPIAMTAHVVYEAIDPRLPATTSSKMIQELIREEIGFSGLLMSDDLSMAALEGPLGTRAKAALSAGCDVVLHCNGHFDEMQEIAEAVGPLNGQGAERAALALSRLHSPSSFDVTAAETRLARLLGSDT